MSKSKSKRIDYPLGAKKLNKPQYKYGVFYRATGDRVKLFWKKAWRNEVDFKAHFKRGLSIFDLANHPKFGFQPSVEELKEAFKERVDRFKDYYQMPCVIKNLTQDELTKFGFASIQEFDEWIGKPSGMTVVGQFNDRQLWFPDIETFYDFVMTTIYEFKEF